MATGEDEVYQTEGDDLEDLYDEVIMSGSHATDQKVDDKSSTHQNNGKIPSRPMNRNLNMSRQFQLYIGNLTWWTSDKDILDAILNLGVTDYVDVKIFDNRSNGQSKGFCQVTFSSEKSSKTVMEMLPKSDIHGKHPVVCYPSKQAFANFDSQTKPQIQGGGNKQQKDQGHQGMGHPGPNHGPPHHHGPRGPPPMRGPPPHMGPQGPRMPPPHMQGNFMHHQMPPRGPPMQQPPMRPQHPPPHFQQGPPQGPPPQGHQGPPPPGPPHHNMPPGPRPEWRGPPQQQQGPPGPPPYIPSPNMGGPPPPINVQQQQPPFYQHQAPPPQGPPPPHPQGPPQPMPPQRYNYGQPPQVQVPPSRPPPQIRSPPNQVVMKPKTLSDVEFEDIMARNRNVSSSAITRAVCDAAAGEYASAIETLVTAITLIKQSKVAHDDRCKILINSLEDTLRGVEPKPYSVKREASRSPSRERDRDRVAHAASRARRDRSRSRDRYRDRSRDRHTRDSRDHKDRYYEYRERERERDRDRDRSWERERERERDRERERERKHAKSPEHTSSSKYRSSSDQVSSR